VSYLIDYCKWLYGLHYKIERSGSRTERPRNITDRRQTKDDYQCKYNMKPFILKRSISRKCLHVLCRKQRKNIIFEIKNNLQSKKSLENCVQQLLNEVSNIFIVTTFNTNIQCMPSPSRTK